MYFVCFQFVDFIKSEDCMPLTVSWKGVRDKTN